jgi:hypothetical protein
MLPKANKINEINHVLIKTGNNYKTKLMRTTKLPQMHVSLIALVVCFDVYGVLGAPPQLQYVPALPMCMRRTYTELDEWAIIENDMQLFRDLSPDGMLVKTILSCSALCCVYEMSASG